MGSYKLVLTLVNSANDDLLSTVVSFGVFTEVFTVISVGVLAAVVTVVSTGVYAVESTIGVICISAVPFMPSYLAAA